MYSLQLSFEMHSEQIKHSKSIESKKYTNGNRRKLKTMSMNDMEFIILLDWDK